MQYRLIFALITIMFASCATASNDTSVAKKMLKPLINKQCSQELDQSKLWKFSTYLMSASNKLQLQKEVCECIAEHALTDIPTKDLLLAVVDENIKNQVTEKAIINSAKGCILRNKQ